MASPSEWPQPAREYCLQAEAMLRSGDPVRALAQLTVALETDPGHRMAYKLARQAMEKVAAHADAARFAELLEHFDDPKQFYDVAGRAMDLGRYRWAAALLRRADALAPDQPGILLDLAVAYAHTNRFATCVEVLERAAEIDAGFWIAYELAWCRLCCHEIDRAGASIDRAEELAEDDTHVDALPKLRAFRDRLARYGPLERPTAREWFFVQCGGALLDVDTSAGNQAGGRYGLCEQPLEQVAGNLARLVRLVEAVPCQPLGIAHAESTVSRALGMALAAHWDIDARPLEPEDPGEDQMIVAAAVEEIFPVEGLWQTRPGQTLFVYDARWCQDGYVTPDVAAVLALKCHYPWATADPDEAARALAEALADALAAAGDDAALAYLTDVADGLVFGHPDRYPRRPVFSSEMPLPTPTMM